MHKTDSQPAPSRLRPLALALLAALVFALPRPAAAQSDSPPPATPSANAVRVTTSMGVFTIELQPDRAPLTVRNFLRYVNEGFYTNTLMHRVVSNFVVQGGGYDAASLKLKQTHEDIFNESGNGLQNKRGAVGMARSNPPHSGNSQFYVNLADNTDLDPLPTRWGYAVFGRITEGMEVLEKIGVVATGSSGPFRSDAPLKPIVIEKIELLAPAGSPQPAAEPPAASPVPQTPPASPPPAESAPAESPPPQ